MSTPRDRRLLGATDRLFAFALLTGIFFSASLFAQPQHLGDFDEDGQPTVLDLVRLIDLLNNPLSLSAADSIISDLNEDGVLGEADVDFLADAILGIRSLPNLRTPPDLQPIPDSTNANAIVINGTARSHRQIIVSGGVGTYTTNSGANGQFSLVVQLQTNRLNRLFISASNAFFGPGIPQAIEIIQDSEPPNLFIDFPTNNTLLIISNTVIAGRVGDMLSGFMGLDVSVTNLSAIGTAEPPGGPATVDVGIGNNGTYERSIPLVQGTNTILVTATDKFGNRTARQTQLIRIEPIGPRMIVLSGDRQATNVHSLLAEPIVVQITHANGAPFANKVVTFDVTRSDGRLFATAVPTNEGVTMLQLFTDVDGLAHAWWRVGGDAGCGNNRVCASSRDIAGCGYFCASATAAPVAQINIGTGNNQKAETDGFTPESLRVWASDSCNAIPGIPITFRVVQGGGRLFPASGQAGQSQGGTNSLTLLSSLTGHAAVNFQLGAEPGLHLVEANYPGNPNLPATFVITRAGHAAGLCWG